MAAWFIPALKAVLPHVGTIISAAAPAFTKKRPDGPVNPSLVQEQIAELQTAVSQNASNIKAVAAQLQDTVAALEAAAAQADARLRRVYLTCVLAAVISVAAALFALIVVT